MSLIESPLTIAGAVGRKDVWALFDSGASYSCMSRRLAESVSHLEPLPEPMEFETAEPGAVLVARYAVRIDFFFPESSRRFSDEALVFDGLSEDLIIGAATMQKWKISLDFEHERVIFDRCMHRLRI